MDAFAVFATGTAGPKRWKERMQRPLLDHVGIFPTLPDDLWLRWRQTGHVLARLFLDYEPGIH